MRAIIALSLVAALASTAHATTTERSDFAPASLGYQGYTDNTGDSTDETLWQWLCDAIDSEGVWAW